jgi:uncharacterized protein
MSLNSSAYEGNATNPRARAQRLYGILDELGSVAVAFSAGVDSTYLLAAAASVLGPGQVVAVTADSPTYTERERIEAYDLAQRLGTRLVLVQTNELHDPNFTENPPDRCYYCKSELFHEVWAVARREGLANVVYGATADDLGDHRPGMEAAKEQEARAPLLEAGLTKADVRELSRQMGLPTWDKPALACLASRFPYGATITEVALQRIEAAEQSLRDQFGLHQLRVRHHDSIARIEVDVADIDRLVTAQARERIVGAFKELGYTYVTVDLSGFRSGSMNDALRMHQGQALAESDQVPVHTVGERS